jgi:hypothetical protein
MIPTEVYHLIMSEYYCRVSMRDVTLFMNYVYNLYVVYSNEFSGSAVKT